MGNYEKENGSVACAVNAFGPSNFMTQFKKSIEKTFEKSPRFKSFFNSDMEIISLASPITHADRIMHSIFHISWGK